jgi:DNA-binding CsgD family transcriptional regulator
LVGRAAELARLRESVTTPPSIVVVEGEAGIGKSRLVRELLADLPGRRCLVGTCELVHEPFPLGPLLDAVQSAATALPDPARLNPVVGALATVLPELGPRLPPALPPLGDQRAERHRLFRGAVRLLAELAPVVLVLEDMHWADEGTAEFVAYLAGRLPPEVSVVMTVRAEVRGRLPIWEALARSRAGEPVRIRLDPLAPDDVVALAGDLLGSTGLPDGFGATLHELTAGIPFVVEEVVGSLADRQTATVPPVPDHPAYRADALSTVAVPSALRDVVLSRLATLDERSREVLGAASVSDTVPDERMLARVLGCTVREVAAGLSQALMAGLLYDDADGRCRFRHALARQAVYEVQPAPTRRWYHLRIAEVLEEWAEPRPVARLAHHFHRAGQLDHFVQYAEAAADLALSHGDDAAAARFLLAAVDAPGLSQDHRVRLVGKLAGAAVHGLAQSEAAPILESLLAGPDLPTWRRGELRFMLGRLHRQQGEARQGYEEIEQSLPDLADRPDLLGKALAVLAVPEVITGRHVSEHVERCRQAGAAAALSGDPETEVAVGIATVSLYLELGDPRAHPVMDDLLASPALRDDPREHARACLNWAQGALHAGEVVRARQLVEECRTVVADAEYLRVSSVLELVEASLDRALGRWDGLVDRCRRLVREPNHFVAANLDSAHLLGSVLAVAGDPEEARELLARVAGAAEEVGVMWPLVPARASLARLLFTGGRFAEAAAEARAGLDVIRATGNWVWAGESVLVLTEAMEAGGTVADAVPVVAEFGTDLAPRSASAAEAFLAWCQGILLRATDPDGAVERLAHVRSEFLRLGLPYEAARAAERLAEWTDPAMLADVLGIYTGLGAEIDAARVRRTLRRLGIAVRSGRGGRRSYGTDLSPREREVALLAADGRTNAEIADRLFVSPRTVESHVASALRKLGGRTRRDLKVLLPG